MQQHTRWQWASGMAMAALAIMLVVIGCETDRQLGGGQGAGDFLEPTVAGRYEHSPPARPNGPRLYERQAMQGQVPATALDGGQGDDGEAERPLRLVAAPDEELWVIARDTPDEPAETDDLPGSGAMLALRPTDDHGPGDPRTTEAIQHVAMPLEHTSVDASIAGFIATVDVTQRFVNHYDTKIEAVYVFPLPDKAAVREFVMTIGERRIRGVIREREEAERLYQEARSQGYRASLLTQERPNVFTQRVANIEPGKAIDVSLRYFETLTSADGWYEFVFPMVVGPRYNPPSSQGDGIGAVVHGAQGVSGQDVEVPYLRPNERSGHDIALTVRLEPGLPVERLRSVNHAIEEHRDAEDDALQLSLAEGETLPNRDFVLRYRLAGEGVTPTLLTHRDEEGQGYFALLLTPPGDADELPRQAMEVVFVLDCSGSMSGRPIEQAKAAMDRAFDYLQPSDTFQIIRFSDRASALGQQPLPATPENIHRARQHVADLHGSGGTRMVEGMRAALDFPHDPERFRMVVFLTDGYIGNESEVLQVMNEHLDEARVFSFGVGSSVNRYLLDRMATAGRGVAAYLSLREESEPVIDLFFDRIARPALTDLEIDFGDMAARDVYPQRLPDLFAGRPIVITGRFDGDPAAAIRIAGRAGSHAQRFEIPPAAEPLTHEAIGSIWARRRIADLAERQLVERDPHGEFAQVIRNTALEHGLMSAYTAFLAVDGSERTAGSEGVTVPVAVPVPEGVRYETTVTE